MIWRKVGAEDGRNKGGPTAAPMDTGEYLVMQAFARDLNKAVQASADSKLRATTLKIKENIAALESRMEQGRAQLLQHLRGIASIRDEAGQVAWVRRMGMRLRRLGN